MDVFAKRHTSTPSETSIYVWACRVVRRGRTGKAGVSRDTSEGESVTAAWESDVLEPSHVRIRSSAGEVVGAGFLIAPDVVCTCAHVVVRALGGPNDADRTGKPVNLDFPLVDGRPRVRAIVESWQRGGADVAVLRLDAPVEGARPAPLVDGTGVWGHTFRAFGYPEHVDHGVWAWGTLRARQGSGLLQMEAHQPGPRILEGFSGGPVWDDAQGGVVGMTVTAHKGASTAYLLPSAALVDEGILKPRCPFKGLSAFTEDDAGFFHGRDSEIDRLYTAVGRRPVTLVAGPSGCGKSSLVRAGVLPRLRAEGMSVTELRPVPGIPASDLLAGSLIGILEPDLDESDRSDKVDKWAERLKTRNGYPVTLRSRVLARADGAGHVLFVDQLEEYAGAEPDEARVLFGLLATLAGKDGEAVLRVVATTRPDSLDVLVTPGTSDLVSDAVQFLAPLAADELARAVTAPVDAVPGLWFEQGLPERIVADAGNEPGRMPLVQFALTELWKRRASSMLTHAAYDQLGGVAGALVKYAEETISGLTRAQQSSAERLFVQLARPGDGDVFSRRPTPADDLADELCDLAQELAPSKLVVLSRATGRAGDVEIIDLAHEALIQLWPRLRQWLVGSRDFRVWQEQLRADLNRWQTHHEPARLLNGTDLAEAERRLADHPQDISPDERGYIQLSRRHSRRGTRLKQGAVGALSVLTVLAVVLALSTWQSLKRTEQQLRTQAAGLLAQAAEGRPHSDPATALQLALAAWNAKPTAETRQTLLHQYARGQYVVGSYPSVWRGRVLGMDATPDGRVLVVRSTRGGGGQATISVVTGALQGKPRAKELSGFPEETEVTALSPDGRFFAAAAAGGAVRLWQLSGSKQPILLDLGDHDVPEKLRFTLDFSSDGKRLLLTMTDNTFECAEDIQQCVPAFAEAWQTSSGSRIRVADKLLPVRGLKEAAFTSRGDTIVTTSYINADLQKRIEIRDLTTGRLWYTSTTRDKNAAELRAGGEILMTTTTITGEGDTRYSQTLGRIPGRKTDLRPTDGVFELDASLGYGIDNAPYPLGPGVGDGGYAEPILTDLRNGHSYRTRIPTAGNTPAEYTGMAAVPRAGGGLTLLVPIGTTLMAVRTEATGNEVFQQRDTARELYASSPDGRFVAHTTAQRLEVMDASRTRLQSVKLPASGHNIDWIGSWTADSQRIVVWSTTRGLYRSYSVKDLSDSVPLKDVVPDMKELDGMAALGGSEMALLTSNGMLARFDAVDAALLSQPFLVHPVSSDNFDGSKAASHGQLVARPGHPGQVAAITRVGSVRGEILLWDVRSPRRITTFSGPGIEGGDLQAVAESLTFNSDGTYLAVQNVDGLVRVWDVDRGKPLTRSAPRSSSDIQVGFGPGNSVVTYLYDKKQIQIYDLMGDGASTTMQVDDAWTVAFMDGPRLAIDTPGLRQTLDLRAEAQFRILCAAAGRAYTKAERKLLPQGTPSEPPCA
nr:trypsin-like peptidase domain-containing protein [Streptomyces caniscabiei]